MCHNYLISFIYLGKILQQLSIFSSNTKMSFLFTDLQIILRVICRGGLSCDIYAGVS